MKYFVAILMFGCQHSLVLARPSSDVYRKLLIATRHNNSKTVLAMLRHHYNVNKYYMDQGTLLMEAASVDAYKVALVLIQYGARVNDLDSFGGSALRYAASGRDIRMARLLIHHGAKINGNKLAISPLCAAARKGSFAMCDFLLKNGANVDLPDRSFDTPLIAATKRGSKALVRLFLSKSKHIDYKNRSGLTAYDIANRMHRPDLVEVFVKYNKSRRR